MIKFDAITSIESIGMQDYYDLEVPETHNYIAQGIIHHNSGKNFMGVRIFVYTAYWLSNLYSPQKYFNFAEGEEIALVNVSLNSNHARNHFFKRFTQALKRVRNPKTGNNWFAEKGMDLRDGQDIQARQVNFPKNITAYSLNSEKDSAEGSNTLLAIFDEVATFKPIKAKEFYDNLWFTAESRWGSTEGSPFRLILLSYLRNEHDFMNYRWEQSKRETNIFRSKKATWEVRPDKKREDFDEAFKKNPETAARHLMNKLMIGAGNSFFVHKKLIRENINKIRTKPFFEDVITIDDLNSLTLKPWFRPFTTEQIEQLINKKDELLKEKIEQLKSFHADVQYFVHVDLAKGKKGGDAAGFGMLHLFKTDMDVENSPIKAYVDFMMQLRAKEGEIDFERIRDFIYKLKNMGFPIAFVSFDGYENVEMIQQLHKHGIKAGYLSVDRDAGAYQTLKEKIYSGLLDYYEYSVFLRECEELIKEGDKVDHPDISLRRSIEEGIDKGGKDVCFAGDTKISLVDGREVSLAVLFKEQLVGKTNYVYSIDIKKQKIEAQLIEKVLKTKFAPKLLRITLDNGEQIKCTYNHPFLLRTGKYKRADELKPNTSLMPLYRKVNNNYLKGYRMFYNPFEDKWHYEHRSFSQPINNQKFVVHHCNFNCLDNSPPNLKIMTNILHSKLHGLLATKEKLGKMHAKAQLFNLSKRGRIIHSNALKKTNKLIKQGKVKRIIWTQANNFRGYVDKRIKKFVYAGAKSRRGAGAWSKGLTQETDERVKNQVEKGTKTIRNQFKNGRVSWNKNRLDIGFNLIFESKYCDICNTKFKQIKSTDWANHRKKCKKRNNHIITKIEVIPGEWVYDLTINKNHNFALSVGVFVHNSDSVTGALAKALELTEDESGDWEGLEF